jgi:hypothetical protein
MKAGEQFEMTDKSKPGLTIIQIDVTDGGMSE